MKSSDGNVKIEQMKKMMNSSKTKISSNNFSSEQVNIAFTISDSVVKF